MDTQIATWEMNLESEVTIIIIREEISTDPSEPYSVRIDRDQLN